MKNAIENIVAWIVVSSADPTEISLTVRGALVGIIPTLMAVAGIAHINLGDGSILTTLVDGIASTVQLALTLVATAMTVYGATRKLWYLIFSRDASQS